MGKNTEKQKKLVSNTFYTIGGMLALNGVLQLVITPLLNRELGADQLGDMLFVLGLVSILCPSVGQALNTSRLVVRRDHPVVNGDYERDLTALWNTGKPDRSVDLSGKYSWNLYGSGNIPAFPVDDFSVLWRCGISVEPELSAVFYLLCADCRRLSGRLRDLPDYGKLDMDLSCRRDGGVDLCDFDRSGLSKILGKKRQFLRCPEQGIFPDIVLSGD